MMDAKYLAEIKARLKRGEYYVPYAPEDVTALIAEVERLTDQHQCDVHNLVAMQATLDQQAKNCEKLLAVKDQQIATLKKALEIASSEVNKAFETLESHHVITMTQKASGIQENVDTWVHRAQEQEANHENTDAI